MKRFILVLIALSMLGFSATAQTLDIFKDAFQTFADDMAGVLAVNSTTGNIWSQAYIGGFPRFGVGLALGANFVPADSAEPLFTAAQATLPSELEKFGIPIPAAAASFKIGLPFLKMDVGVKGGLIPEAASNLLSGKGVDATYQSMGLNLRYALLKDRLVIPAVSLGASWNYVKGSAATGLGAGPTNYDYDSGSFIYTVTVDDPDLKLEWEANTFDFTLQASKNLLIFTPYVGAGFTIGATSAKGGMSATTTVSDTDPGTTTDEETIAIIEGATGISITDQGFLVSADSTAPTFRIYGGTSVNILILKLDLMASYVPATKALGAQVMARIQL